jgi:hypothetical protein
MRPIETYPHSQDCCVWSDVRSGHKRLLQENKQLKKDAKVYHDVSHIIFILRGIYKELLIVCNLRWGIQDVATWNRGSVKWTISKLSEEFENVISFVTALFHKNQTPALCKLRGIRDKSREKIYCGPYYTYIFTSVLLIIMSCRQ